MAEIKTGVFAKNVQKRLSRAQEKVLQKLGKADETKDEQFEQCVQNFKRQESEGARLQREMKAYIAAVKGMQQASMKLTESLHEVYEPDWHGRDDVMSIGKNCDALWEDFHQKLVDSTILALDTYLVQFPDIKIRVAKRSRKLIDYDSARHHLETLQASAIKNERKVTKAEEDLKKAQKVFDDLNVDLQDELPNLWDSRVGFYVNTFKSVSSLEAKFHREISIFCHKLYEVMNKLAEQHSDKMFTIQGAPSDSGPLRLARTPTPPEDESPEGSPVVSPNHTLRPTSPGPPRPKSPSQLKMGPPKPPPPKVTPNKEMAQEQIISLFDGGFPEISVTSPQSNEIPTESLLDLDFDPFKPDSNSTGQTQSSVSQPLSWDLWTTNTEAQPAADTGFNASWTADFGSAAQDLGDVQPATDGQGWPPAEGWPTDTVPQGEPTEEVRSWDAKYDQEPNPDCEACALRSGKLSLPFEQDAVQEGTEEGWASEQSASKTQHSDWTGNEEGGATEMTTPGLEESGNVPGKSLPEMIFTDEFGQEISVATEGSEQGSFTEEEGNNLKCVLIGQGDVDGSASEYETAEEWGDAPGQNSGWISADDEGPISDQDTTSSNLNHDDFARFIGNHFIANRDQLVMTESTKPNKAVEMVHYSSDYDDFSTADSTHNNEQIETVDNILCNISESRLCSDAFCKSDCHPFGSGSDPLANTNKGLFSPSESENCHISQKVTSDPLSLSMGDIFTAECSSKEEEITFPLDHFQAGDLCATKFTQDSSATETNQKSFENGTKCPFTHEINQDTFSSETDQDHFASETNQDPLYSETDQDTFASFNNSAKENNWNFFNSKNNQHPFINETKWDFIVSEAMQDMVASKIDNGLFATGSNQGFFPRETDHDPFTSETTHDPFTRKISCDPFGSESNHNSFVHETSWDPFASENDQDHFNSETSQNTFTCENNQDDFASETNQDHFTTDNKQNTFAIETNPDLFARETNQDHIVIAINQVHITRETAQDSLAIEGNQGWAGCWDSTMYGQTNGDSMHSSSRNRFVQWAAFTPATANLESSGKDSCQELDDSSGLYLSDGQGDIITDWPGNIGLIHDPNVTCLGQYNIASPKSATMEKTASVKEQENSDLSEDEVANRRYGKLYQEIDAEKEEVDASVPAFVADFDKMSEAPEGAETGTEAAPEGVGDGEGELSPALASEPEGSVTTPPAETTTEPAETTAAGSPPAEMASSTVESPEADEAMAAEQTETTQVDDIETEQVSQEAPESAPVAEPHEEPSTEALAPAEDKESPIEETPTIESKPEDETSTVETKPDDETGMVETKPEDETTTLEVKPEEDTDTFEVEPGETGTIDVNPRDEPSKEGASKNLEEEDKMPIPSVVIEPASSNEGDDDRDGDIVSPVTTSGDGVTPDSQTVKDISSSGMPPGFLYKVETMHDFEAANSDELELKRGDIVLVVPTELVEDQEAGWLTGIRERDWLHQGASAQKGLFPENFIQRLG